MGDAIQKVNVPIPWSSGLDLLTDRQQTPLARLQRCDNGVFVTPLSIRKRDGNKALPTTIANSTIGLTNIATARALMAFGDELIECDPSRLYSFDDASQKWIEKGATLSIVPTVTPIVRNTYEQAQQDGVPHASGLQCFAWEDTSGGIRYSVRDETTGQMVVASALLSSTAIKPKTLAIGAYFAIFHVETAGTPLLNIALVSVGNPAATPVIATVTANSGGGFRQINPTTYTYDACVCVNPNVATTAPTYVTMYAAFNNNAAGNGISVFSFASAAPSVVAQTFNTSGLSNVLTVFADLKTGGPIVATWFSGGSISWGALSPFVTSGSPTLLNSGSVAGSPTHVISLTGHGTSTTVAGDFDLYYSQWAAGATPTMDVLLNVAQTTAYSTATSIQLSRSAALAGKAFLYEGMTYVPCVYQSPLNSTYFVISSGGQIVARNLSGLAGGIPGYVLSGGNWVLAHSGQTPMLAESSALDAATFMCALLIQDFLTTFPNTTTAGTPTTAVYTQTGVVALEWDFLDATRSYLRSIIANSLFLTGGFLQQYDGALVTEAGFHVYPENLDSDISTMPAGGALGSATVATTYWWCFTYQWTDNSGAVQISEPSVPVAVARGVTQTFASFAGPPTGTASIAVPTLRLTNKTTINPSSPVTINGYRTIGTDPNTFYLAQSTQAPSVSGTPNAPILNDVTVDSVTFVDNMSDDDLQGNPRLYSTGGVLENEAPPPFIATCLFQSRMFGISAENPDELWYSQTVVPGTALSWSSFLKMNLDSSLGGGTGLGVIDGNLAIFGRTGVLYTQGTGPDETGNNNGYADPIPVRTGVGCVNPRSVIGTEDGLQFQSTKGLRLLDRSLNERFIGAPVSELVEGMNVSAALLMTTVNEVRHMLLDPTGASAGRAVVMDTFAAQWLATPNAAAIHSWSSFPNLTAVDACIWRDLFVFATANGAVLVETPGLYSDNGSAIAVTVETGPIRTNGIGNMQRIYRLFILGTYESAHVLNVSVAYNGGPFGAPTAITPQTPDAWGGDPFWGDSSPWGGGYQPYFWEVLLETVKCESIRVRITDADTTPGEGMSLSGLMLRVGVQDGGFRAPPTSMF